MGIILVSGALANKPGNGGGTWERMSWVIGLQRLGFEVYFIEQIAPGACIDATGAQTSFSDSTNLAWFRSVAEWFGIDDRATLIYGGGEQSWGRTWPELLDLADSTDLFINLSGHFTLAPLLERIRVKAYVDVDPGFTQFWHADPAIPFRVEGHEFYFTIGENIGTPGCAIPTGGIRWRPTRQPVVLEQWPNSPSPGCDRFTTIASWRGPFGPIHADGRTYGLKVHEFRKVWEFPQRIATPCEIALEIHASDEKDRAELVQRGWRLVDPHAVAGNAEGFRGYVQNSSAEFSVAQGVYVDTNCGWFSDRSVRYLASGKPVLVQDTGFGRHYPVGEGLLSFHTLDEAVCGAEAIAADYSAHGQAAREIAVRYFDSDLVLGRLLEEVGIAP